MMKNFDPNKYLEFFDNENRIFDELAFEMNCWGEPDIKSENKPRAEFLDSLEFYPEEYAYLADLILAEEDFFGEYNPNLQGVGNRRDLAIGWLVRKSHVPVRDNPRKDAKMKTTGDTGGFYPAGFTGEVLK